MENCFNSNTFKLLQLRVSKTEELGNQKMRMPEAIQIIDWRAGKGRDWVIESCEGQWLRVHALDYSQRAYI